MPVPASVSEPPDPVVSPAGLGLPRSEHVQLAGHGSAGPGAASVVVTGAPAVMLLNEAVPYLLPDPDATAMPCMVVVGRSTLTVLPGIAL